MFLKHQPWHDPSHSNQALFEFEWNMWKKRQRPFQAIEAGDLLLTVTGGGPSKGRIINEVHVDSLAKGHYASKEEAWALLKSGIEKNTRDDFALTMQSFLAHPYTQAAPSEGWLLAWAGFPTMIINAPRPAILRFNQNGWAELPDEDLDEIYLNAVAVDDDTDIWIVH